VTPLLPTTGAPPHADGTGREIKIAELRVGGLRRRAELQLELRVAAMAFRFPAWSRIAADAIRSPIDFRRLVIELDAQRSRRWTAGEELALLRRCVRRLQVIRGERGSNEGAVRWPP
jgi:hypothetical protein